MDSLMNSVVRVTRSTRTTIDGTLASAWQTVPGKSRVKCRLDLNFVRPGKDQLTPLEAGRAPDRVGVAFFMEEDGEGLMAGDRIVAVLNDMNKIPVRGTFELRAAPDEAQDFSGAHHYEIGIVEVAQSIAASG